MRHLARHAAPAVIEGSVIPFVLFVVSLRLGGITTALTTGVAYAYGRIWWRRRRGGQASSFLVLGALTLTVRTVITLCTGSTLLFFLQPSISGALTGGAFGVSAGTARPLAARFTGDLLPLPEGLLGQAPVQRFFARVSLLWGGLQVAHAALSVWLLSVLPTGSYVLVRTVGSWVLTLAAIGATVVWFRRSMARSGLRVVRATVAPCAR